MSYWIDQKYHEWASSGGITPFDPTQINPASFDLTLGNQVRRPIRDAVAVIGEKDNEVWQEAEVFTSFILAPGEFALFHSMEYVKIPGDCISFLYSKSSVGRLGLEHLHAGLGDPSFIGQWTWELHNVSPWSIVLKPGVRVMQMVIAELCWFPDRSYMETGSYNGQTGPTPAR